MPNSLTAQYSPTQKRDVADAAITKLFFEVGEHYRNFDVKRVTVQFNATHERGLEANAWATVSLVLGVHASESEAALKTLKKL